MAPPSASPQPHSGRADEAAHGELEPQAARRGKQDGAGPAQEQRHTQGEGHAQGQCEAYGPLSVERQVKQDGRALILYARQGSPRSMRNRDR
jgi:hypothetical protein